MTEQTLRQSVADIINGWVGGKKGSKQHTEILSIYNNYKPLARGYTVKKNDAYCATTVSAAYIKAGIAQYTGTECGVQEYVKVAQKRGIWVENDAHIPKIGDACVYDWEDNGIGDNTGYADHIGIVTAISGSYFTVTEGNMSGGKVGKRQMMVNGRYIRGFICPNYAEIVKPIIENDEKEEEKMTQAEFNKMMDNYLADLAQKDAADWGEEWDKAKQWAEETEIIKGDQYGNKMYQSFTTRQSLALILYRFQNKG